MTPASVSTVAALLRETAAAHHHAFRDRDGEDPAWAQWYADHAGMRLAELLGREIDRDDLASRLVELDRRYQVEQPAAPWEDFYAAHLIAETS